ncbi:MAG: hypothetical protein O2954_16735 [bacterium]|nr:hypothetical protein [bacterium]
MRNVSIGNARVSGLCIGGNPFSGFSHQSPERTKEMLDYFTPERIKETLHTAEEAGINTFFGRTDDHIFGILRDYWKEGGKIQWFAQICVERGKPDVWRDWLQGAVDLGAAGAYIHGGVVDMWHAQEQFDNFTEALDRMRKGNVAAGFAGHRPQGHEWIRDNLEPDFQMCSYYNPSDRTKSAHHVSTGEKWEYEDRDLMLGVIATIPSPVVHYKVFAGGNKPVIEAFETMGKAMRDTDIACVGLFPKDDPDIIAKDVALFEQYVDQIPEPVS